MAKPVIPAVDGLQHLRAVEQDLRHRYAREYRILRTDYGESALDTLGKLELRGGPVTLLPSAESVGPVVPDPLPQARQQAGYGVVGTRLV